ncbi:MAG: hypothetical protein WCS03_16795 [Bacteroidota bacterium]
MKTKLIFLMMTLLLACLTARGQDTITVVDKRKSNTLENVAVGHKDKDVAISRENIPGVKSKTYWVNMYRMDCGKLRMYPFGTSANDDYDKAIYKWVNDTTITFKLINFSNNKSESFRMTGNGNRSNLARE